jgi:hypothetical protein
MIFAFATDEKTLTVFSDEKEAISYCEGFDVSQGGWLFFAADGSPLEPLFSVPASEPGFVITHGRYSLRSTTIGRLGHLASLLPSVAGIEGIPSLNTVAEIERLLTHHSNGTG